MIRLPAPIAVRAPRVRRSLLTGCLAFSLGAGLLLAVPTAPSAFAATTRPSTTAGALPIGQANYSIPAGAIFVSPAGTDAATGTQQNPVRTISRGIGLAPTGGTVVLRAGSYHETLYLTKSVTLQNYPGEAAWLDGAEQVTGWTQSGATWRHDGWDHVFDHSPTYTKGAPDSTQPGWAFVDQTNAPLAAHPDQVFINGTQLSQVKDLASVKAGSFYYDEAAKALHVGSNPGTDTWATSLAKAINIHANDVTLRGFGVRRYATSMPMMGAVVVDPSSSTSGFTGAVIENVRITDTATQGLSVNGANATVRKVTLDHNGLLGMHARYADGLVVDALNAYANNSEHFNTAPVSGGLKFGQTRGVTVKNSWLHDNTGPGLWTDLSVYDINVANNDFTDNATDGLFLEISAKSAVVNNYFKGNGADAIKVNNTANVQVWNNTFVGNKRPIWIVQDTRRNTDPNNQAVDKRQQPFPDPTMTWQLRNVTVSNNVFAGSPSGTGLVSVEDLSRLDTAETMNVTANGNLYQRTSTAAPQWTNVWSRGPVVNPYVFTTVAGFKSQTGQEARGVEYTTTSGPVAADGALSSSVNQSGVALPLPADLASLAGRSTGTVALGAWLPGSSSPSASPSASPNSAPPASPSQSSAPAQPTSNKAVGAPFTIGVIGDTQNETNNSDDTRYPTRTQWIANNKSQLNLAYVLHTGDNVNWGWLVPSQYDNAKKAIAKLTNAGIPFSLTIGNHDTRAVGWDGVAGSTGYGGSAYANNPECPTRLQVATCSGLTPKLVRQTDEFNAAFPLSIEQNLGGSFEPNKIDNTWTTFTTSGTKWLVLTLELWPRTAVIDWAENVVKTHADYNVIIQTHSYLEANATVSTNNGGYGANAPSLLESRIIAKYPNVKLVFSGHTGGYNKRSDNYNGNTVVAYLGNELGSAYNPVRLLTIDPATGTVTGRVHNPKSGSDVSGQDTSDTISIIGAPTPSDTPTTSPAPKPSVSSSPAPTPSPAPSLGATPPANPTSPAKPNQPSYLGSLKTSLTSSLRKSKNLQFTSPKASEIKAMKKKGYTSSIAVKGKVSTAKTAGLTAIKRTYNSKTGEYRWIRASAKPAKGFKVKATAFYAPITPSDFTIPVYRMTKSGRERLAFGASERTGLSRSGWKGTWVLYFVAPK